jgi:hypothetical protein
VGCDVHGFLEVSFTNDEGEVHWSDVCQLHPGRNYLLFALLAEVRRYDHGFGQTARIAEYCEKNKITEDQLKAMSEDELAVLAKKAIDTGITYGEDSFAPKGFPKDAGYRTERDYCLLVGDEHADSEGWCSTKQAKSWVESKASDIIETNEDGSPKRISGPDWHSATWLSTEEVGLVVERFQRSLEARIPEAKAEHDKFAADMERIYKDTLKGTGKVKRTPEETAKIKKRFERMIDWNRAIPTNDEQLFFMRGLHAMMKELERGDRKARIVVWFDN